VTASDTLTLVGTGTDSDGTFPSGIFANARGTAAGAGAAGTIVVSAPHIMVTDGAAISSSTSGPGDAGTVVVEGRTITLSGGAQILGRTLGQGQGGSVTVTASDTLTLAGTGTSLDGALPSGIFANTRGTKSGAGAAGTIVVSAPHIMITGGAVIISASFGPGRGGSVTVTASDTLTLAGTGTFLDGALPSGIFASAQKTEGVTGQQAVLW
jgi:uncharacterized RDD family membrane protein YckC